ncbi:MAG: hypothetical protein GY894_08060 [Planctomycetes bacterium]|nr:hypothetical protein [Planctomycetota bacterium]MCP4839300.1 hypothetical protein [Planctomycetota bacterium]
MTHPLRSIGWSLYATSSWTWCIGMFLPVLLLQWFGWGGFLLIAIPNCIGAAAMGLLLGSPSASRQFCRRHPTAIGAFVSLTIAFHLVFLSIVGLWLSSPELLLSAGWLIWPAAAFAIAWVLSFAPRNWWPWLGGVAFASGGIIIAVDWGTWICLGWSGERPPLDLLWLAPVFVIGFLLCPWLDAPFHRARQETHGPLASALLAPLFLCMLLVTASYWSLTESTATLAILLWLFGQSVFTIAANLREMRRGGVAHDPDSAGLWGPILIAVLGIAVLVTNMTWDTAINVYLGFLAIYGIAFPAILLAWCRRGSPLVTTLGIVRLTVLLLIAGWLSNIGFITGPAWVAVLPAVFVLATPAIFRRA